MRRINPALPPPAPEGMAQAVKLTLAAPGFRNEPGAAGLEGGALLSPTQDGAYIAVEQAKWRPVLAATGARLERQGRET